MFPGGSLYVSTYKFANTQIENGHFVTCVGASI